MSRFMKQYIKFKEKDDDHGVYASMFDVSLSYPAAMPTWVLREEEKSRTEVRVGQKYRWTL